MVGSLLLGLFDDTGRLNHVGITASFTTEKRVALVAELAPLREDALDGHPWAEWAEWEAAARESGQRMPGAVSRWNRDHDLTWEPLRAERVCEVAYDHLQGDRFRHATTFRALAPRQAPLGLPLRPARVDGSVRAGGDLRPVGWEITGWAQRRGPSPHGPHGTHTAPTWDGVLWISAPLGSFLIFPEWSLNWTLDRRTRPTTIVGLVGADLAPRMI